MENTGLSIKTLAEALWGAWSLKATAAAGRKLGRRGIAVDADMLARAWQHRDRQTDKFLAALCAKSERYEALERVEEAARAWGAAHDKMTELSHNPNYNLDDMTRSVRAVNEMGRRLRAALAAPDAKP